MGHRAYRPAWASCAHCGHGQAQVSARRAAGLLGGRRRHSSRPTCPLCMRGQRQRGAHATQHEGQKAAPRWERSTPSTPPTRTAARCCVCAAHQAGVNSRWKHATSPGLGSAQGWATRRWGLERRELRLAACSRSEIHCEVPSAVGCSWQVAARRVCPPLPALPADSCDLSHLLGRCSLVLSAAIEAVSGYQSGI